MAVKIVYQSHQGDGYLEGYVEALVDSEVDLVGLEVGIGNVLVDPAPGSIAYTPGVELLWHRTPAGSWIKFK